MRIEEAIKVGFKKFEDGKWRKPITQRYSNGRIVHTWTAYILKKCRECKDDFLASHKIQVFCSNKCNPNKITSINPGWRLGKKFPNEKGGYGNTRNTSKGYIAVYMPGHPLADKKGRVAQHRLIMFNHLKGKLDPTKNVHHINGNKKDNRIENLVVLSKAEHNSHHKKEETKRRKRNKFGRFI